MKWSDILFTLALPAILAAATFAHWRWTGRKQTITYSYSRVIRTYAKWFGVAFAVVSGLILVVDLIYFAAVGGGQSPWLLVLVGVAFVGLGWLIWRMFGYLLRRERS
jgi:hypothetical protein